MRVTHIASQDAVTYNTPLMHYTSNQTQFSQGHTHSVRNESREGEVHSQLHAAAEDVGQLRADFIFLTMR